jgi:hypothetical protein
LGILTVLLAWQLTGHASGDSIEPAGHEAIIEQGMYVLGGWSLLNIGSALALRRDGSNRYFDQMNGLWNLVNLGIAGATLGMGAPEAELANKIFALNVGLDVAYLATAAYLRERGKNASSIESKNRLVGYANSIALQGAFLLLFDVAMWWRIESWQDQQLTVIPSANGITVMF